MKSSTVLLTPAVLRNLLEVPGMVNFDKIPQENVQAELAGALESFLNEAKADFKELLATAKNNANYTTIVLRYLTSGRSLSILYSFVDTLNSVSATEMTRALVEKFEPMVVAFGNEVLLSSDFYKLLTVVYTQKLSTLEKRSIELLMRDMRHAGVLLNEAKRKKISALNNELSSLAQKFENNVIDSRKQFSYHFADDTAFGLMPESDRAEAREQAAKIKKDGYVFTLLPPQYSAIMKYCTTRAVRELFYNETNQVAAHGKFDNRPLVLKILSLRHQKAALLGHASFADYALEERMAKKPKAVFPLLDGVYKKAKKQAKAEVRNLEKFARNYKEAPLLVGSGMQEWDIAFYSDRYKRVHLAFDDAKLRDYFELTAVVEGLFAVSQRLYGLNFKEIKEGIYADGVRVFEVYKNGELLSYYIADFYARPSKRGGAWCNMLREGFIAGTGSERKHAVPIMINVMNFPKPTKEHPALLMHRDVETLFHEFGHAVHAMLSSTQLPNLNGFHVEWDFVEFPSQIFENWTWETSVLNLFARHYKTKKLLPKKDLASLWKLKTFFGGYHVVRQNEFGYLDMKLHSQKAPASVKALDALCEKLVSSRAVLPKPKNYHMYASFGHIFAGGYSAGYYSYLWAEILEADCYELLRKKGVLKKSTGALFAKHILAPGTREPGDKLFKGLMKRKAKIQPLLKKYGIL